VAEKDPPSRRTSHEKAEEAACKEETILEEMVGSFGQPSPTVYMVGCTAAVVADQLLTPCGTINLGNVSPATQVPPSVVDVMAHACAELGRYLNLRGQWGADFVLDDSGAPVIVDLNMGRPNGSFSYYCWRARQSCTTPRSIVTTDGAGDANPLTQQLALAATTYCPPAELRVAMLAAALDAKGLLWDPKRGDGIILAQHLPGVEGGGTVLAASFQGTAAAQELLVAFRAHLGTPLAA